MASRHLARVIAMQTLYAWDFLQSHFEKNEVKENFNAKDILEYNLLEFGPDIKGEEEFIRSLVKGVFEHWEDINGNITKLAPEWPLPQINTVDRNVLRLGIFELQYGDPEAVPPKVAINEAIELAKNFGGPSSGRFVNGVLGTFYNNIRTDGDTKNVKGKRAKIKEDKKSKKSVGKKSGGRKKGVKRDRPSDDSELKIRERKKETAEKKQKGELEEVTVANESVENKTSMVGEALASNITEEVRDPNIPEQPIENIPAAPVQPNIEAQPVNVDHAVPQPVSPDETSPAEPQPIQPANSTPEMIDNQDFK